MSGKTFVVCHMLASLDGKIDGAFFGAKETAPALTAYGELRKYYECQATVYGTTTMLGGYASGRVGELPRWDSGNMPPLDWVNVEGRDMGNFIVSFDPKGELAFASHKLEKKGRAAAHVIQVVTEQASPAYLSCLRKKSVSYLTAGKDKIDCAVLLGKLQELFQIDRVMAAGGGILNWSFLSAGLVDEISLVVVPVVDGSTTAASIFEAAPFFPDHDPVAFRLKEAKPLAGDAIWLRYEKR